MKKIAKVIVDSLSHEGRGIAHVNGKATFIDFALPGEEVMIEYTRHHPKWDEATVTEVISASPQRVTPKCDVYQICGGCSLQHMDPAAQIQFKQKMVLEQLQHFANVQPTEILPAITGKAYGYRRKARLSVRHVAKKDKLLIGFRERQGRFVTDTESCAILSESIGLKLMDLQQLISQLAAFRQIAQIEVAVANNATALVLRNLQVLDDSDLKLIKQFAEQHQFWIYLQPGDHHSVHRIWPETNEQLKYRVNKFDLELLFEPLDFTQINDDINQQMLEKAVDLLALTPEEKVLDLFCGLGNFSLPLAKQCKNVVAVEVDQAMIQRGKMNAEHNQLTNLHFYACNLMAEPVGEWVNTQYDAILLDPPRTGASEVIKLLPKWQAKRIVYVSCHPATMARDIAEIVKHGYHLAKLGVLDMFPHTRHVESIALLEYGRKN